MTAEAARTGFAALAAARAAATRAATVLTRAGKACLRVAGKSIGAAARFAGKCVAAVWRFAGELDSALWGGLKRIARVLFRGLKLVGGVALDRGRDLALWLPSRTGRAYSAFSGVILMIALLWIADELRAAQTASASGRDLFVAPIDVADPILATLDGRYIHLSEVQAAALASGALQPGETLTPETAFKRELVESYVEQRLLAREATEEGIHRNPDVAKRLAAARERILASALMEKRIATTVTDDAVQGLYNRNVDATRLGEQVKCRHILVATEMEARMILAELRVGAEFADIARVRSLDRATGPQGGETGYLSRNQMTPAFAEAAFGTPEGEMAPLFFTEAGWNILEVVDRRRSGGVPFAAVADNIRRFLRLKTIEATIEELEREGGVVYYLPEAEESEPPPPPLRDGAPGG